LLVAVHGPLLHEFLYLQDGPLGVGRDGLQPPASRRLGRRLFAPLPAALQLEGRRTQFAERASRLGQRPTRCRQFIADAGQRLRADTRGVRSQQPLDQLPQFVVGQPPDPLLQLGIGFGRFGQRRSTFRGGRDQVLVHLEEIGQRLQGRGQFAQPRGHRRLSGFVVAGTRQPGDVQRTQIAADQQLPDGRDFGQRSLQPVPDLVVGVGLRLRIDFKAAARPVLVGVPFQATLRAKGVERGAVAGQPGGQPDH